MKFPSRMVEEARKKWILYLPVYAKLVASPLWAPPRHCRRIHIIIVIYNNMCVCVCLHGARVFDIIEKISRNIK